MTLATTPFGFTAYASGEVTLRTSAPRRDLPGIAGELARYCSVRCYRVLGPVEGSYLMEADVYGLQHHLEPGSGIVYLKRWVPLS